jgi:hypothetical protein
LLGVMTNQEQPITIPTAVGVGKGGTDERCNSLTVGVAGRLCKHTNYVHYCQLSSTVEKAGCAKLVPVPAADEDKGVSSSKVQRWSRLQRVADSLTQQAIMDMLMWCRETLAGRYGSASWSKSTQNRRKLLACLLISISSTPVSSASRDSLVS